MTTSAPGPRPAAPGRHRPPASSSAYLLPQDRRAQTSAAVALLALIIVGVVSLASRPDGTGRSAIPPTPPSPVVSSTAIGRSTTSPPTARASEAPISCQRAARSPLGGADPSRICIPTIRVDATIMQLGLNQDRTVQVPPLSRVGDAGWYKYSATAGAVGPTVILGHVDSAQYGAGVFFRLGQLRGGDRVVVARADGTVATFRVDRVVEVSKQRFPSQEVYGPTSGPALRLVTCGGRFDAATGNYLDNIIAYASLLSLART